MGAITTVRDYNFSDAVLVQLCDDISGSVARDLDDFGNFAVTQTTLDSLETKRDAFDAMQTDGEMLGLVSIATQNKNGKRDELENTLKAARMMAENKWGTSDAYYRQFGFEGMVKLSDAKLLRQAKKVHRLGVTHLADMASEGLDQAKLDLLQTQYADFDDLVDDKEKAIENRDIKTQERRKAGNEIYKELVRLCNIGKQLYEKTNEAKYNDYVIYNSSTGQQPAEGAATLAVTVVSAGTGNALAGADVYLAELEVTVTTDANGVAPFEGLEPATTYHLQAIAPGHDIADATAEVTVGTNQLTITLNPA